jgi:DNA-binding IclR family transcriptional regulator
MAEANLVPALARGVEILQLITQEELAAAALEQRLGIPKASLTRILKCLEQSKFIEIDPETRLIRGGRALVLAGDGAYRRHPLTIRCQPLLHRLAERWKQTFVVYRYVHPFEVIWQVKCEPAGGIPTRLAGFSLRALNLNAQGQLFLSRLDDETIRAYMQSPLIKRATERTIMTPEAMLARVADIRRQGYAVQERENHPAMRQLAVPLPGPRGETLALGCFLPLEETGLDALRDDLFREAGMLKENS